MDSPKNKPLTFACAVAFSMVGSCLLLAGHGRTLVNFIFLYLWLQTTISHSNATIRVGQSAGWRIRYLLFLQKTLQIWIYVSPSVTLLGEQKPHLFCLPPAALLKETTHLDILFPTLCRNSRRRRRFFLRYTHSQFTEWRLPLVLFIYLTITFLCFVYKTTITTTFLRRLVFAYKVNTLE